MCGFLSILVRRVDEEQPHTRRPGALERVRQAVPGQPAVSLGHPRAARGAEDRTRRESTEDWRLLRGLHGRGRRERARRRSAQTLSGLDRRIENREGSAGRARRSASLHRNERAVLHVLVEPGFRELGVGDRICGRRRARPARSRLLHERRRQIEGHPHQVSRARAADVRAARRSARNCDPQSRGGDGDRDGPGESDADARREARPAQSVSQGRFQGAAGTDAGLRLDRVRQVARTAAPGHRQRHRAGLLQGGGAAAEVAPDR